MFLRLRERAIGDEHLAVLPPQRCGVPGALERFPAEELPSLSKHFVLDEAPIDHRVTIAFGNPFPFLLVEASEAYILHEQVLCF